MFRHSMKAILNNAVHLLQFKISPIQTLTSRSSRRLIEVLSVALVAQVTFKCNQERLN